MDVGPFLERLREDEGLTSDLDQAEALRMLDWLGEQVGQRVAKARSEEKAWEQVDALARRARGIARVVGVFRDEGAEAAAQRAAQAKIAWPADAGELSVGELLERLLQGEAS
ncbi:MAG: hypothetical protein U0840_13230 [Gemmataceae bacterium]